MILCEGASRMDVNRLLGLRILSQRYTFMMMIGLERRQYYELGGRNTQINSDGGDGDGDGNVNDDKDMSVQIRL
jgi:hypothetical protein